MRNYSKENNEHCWRMEFNDGKGDVDYYTNENKKETIEFWEKETGAKVISIKDVVEEKPDRRNNNESL